MSRPDQTSIRRRHVLKGTVVASLAAVTGLLSGGPAAAIAADQTGRDSTLIRRGAAESCGAGLVRGSFRQRFVSRDDSR